MGNFCHTIDCSSYEVLKKKQSFGKDKCDMLGTKGQ